MTGSLYVSGSIITPIFVDYEEKYSSPSISGGGLTLDLANGNVFAVTFNATISSITISNPPRTNNAGSFTLILTKSTATQYSITWPASVKWASGIAPVLTQTDGKKDIFTFVSVDGGTNWYGIIGAQNL